MASQNYKRVVLEKLLEGTLFEIYPRTLAELALYSYTTGTGAEAVTTDTNVSAYLDALRTKFNDYDTSTQVDAKVAAAVSRILGSEELDSTLDSIKEIQTFLSTHQSAADSLTTEVAALKANLGVASDATASPAVVASGLHADVEDLEDRINTLEAVGSTKVEQSENNGYIKIDDVQTLVYDDTSLQTRVGTAAVAADPGNNVEARAATGLFLAIDNINNTLGSYTSSENTVKGRIKALEELCGDNDDTKASATLYGFINDIYGVIGENTDAAATNSLRYRLTALENELGSHADNASATIGSSANLTAFARIAALEANLGVASDSSASPAVVASGLHADVEALQAQVNALTTLQYVTSNPATPSAGVVYMLELA